MEVEKLTSSDIPCYSFIQEFIIYKVSVSTKHTSFLIENGRCRSGSHSTCITESRGELSRNNIS
jgi:hypothetical protein